MEHLQHLPHQWAIHIQVRPEHLPHLPEILMEDLPVDHPEHLLHLLEIRTAHQMHLPLGMVLTCILCKHSRDVLNQFQNGSDLIV